MGNAIGVTSYENLMGAKVDLRGIGRSEEYIEIDECDK